MKRVQLFGALAAFLAACGSGEPAPNGGGAGQAAQPSQPAATMAAVPPVPTGPMTMPDWYQLDEAKHTVHLTVTAGATSLNNFWNMNGGMRGSMAVTVPEGYTVTIDFVNHDPNMPHSLTISRETSSFTLPPSPEPAFKGAQTPNPSSMLEATLPGESDTIEFVASEAGTYSMVCLIPGHSALGMWLYFLVSGEGEAGIQGA